MCDIPPVLEPDHDLSLGEVEVTCHLAAFLLAQECLLDEVCLQSMQLSAAEHLPLAST